MGLAEDIALEIDRQVEFLHRCRSVFPRLEMRMVGQSAFRAPDYYQQLGYDVAVKLSEPMTAEFIDGLFEMGHWLNENFVVRLWAILEAASQRNRKHVGPRRLERLRRVPERSIKLRSDTTRPSGRSHF